MNQLAKWSLALVATTGLAFVVSASIPVSQDTGKKTETQQEKEKMAKAKEAAMKAHADRMAAFKKAMPTLKTPLSEAILLAEKETKGKAHSGDVEMGKDGKLYIEVGLLVGDKLEAARVDPETKKVALSKHGEEEEHEEGDDEDEDEDEDEGEEEEEDE